jgi:hypothetical protein
MIDFLVKVASILVEEISLTSLLNKSHEILLRNQIHLVLGVVVLLTVSWWFIVVIVKQLVVEESIVMVEL